MAILISIKTNIKKSSQHLQNILISILEMSDHLIWSNSSLLYGSDLQSFPKICFNPISTNRRKYRAQLVFNFARTTRPLRSAGQRIASHHDSSPTSADAIPIRQSMLVLSWSRPGCDGQETKLHPNQISQLAHGYSRVLLNLFCTDVQAGCWSHDSDPTTTAVSGPNVRWIVRWNDSKCSLSSHFSSHWGYTQQTPKINIKQRS